MEILAVFLALALIAYLLYSPFLFARQYRTATRLKKRLEEALQKAVPEEQAKAAWAQFEADKQTIARTLADQRQAAEAEITKFKQAISHLSETAELEEVGMRRRTFTYEDPQTYQIAIKGIEDRLSDMIKNGNAAKCTINWTINGSERQAESMIKKLLKIAVRTFNGDADAAIARVKWNNLQAMEARIRKSEETIEKNLDKWGIIIVDAYRDLKIQELRMTFEQEEVRQRIRDEQRALKDQMRDEEKARREAEKVKADAERDERQIQQALAKAKAEMETAHTADMSKQIMRIKELELQLAQAGEMKLRAISMAQLTKLGHVYIISNLGAFGDNVFKIGMTRRLDPMDRVWELSDASVPFDFDVHGLIKSENAPALEAKLHDQFSNRRINKVNERKEFFRVSISEIQSVIATEGLNVQLTELAEAKEYHLSRTGV